MLNPRHAVDSPLTSNAVAPDTRKGGTDLSVARDSLAGANDSCNVLRTEVFTKCQKVSEGKLVAC